MQHDTLHPEGLYNPTLRFAFTNITDEEFTSFWGGQPIAIKPGKTVELTHHLAVKLTKELVDKIMQGLTRIGGEQTKKEGTSLGVPSARKIWEDRIVKELRPDEESPEIQVMRAELKAEILAQQNKEQRSEPVHVPTSLEEFADLTVKNAPKEAKKPLKVKQIEATDTKTN